LSHITYNDQYARKSRYKKKTNDLRARNKPIVLPATISRHDCGRIRGQKREMHQFIKRYSLPAGDKKVIHIFAQA